MKKWIISLVVLAGVAAGGGVAYQKLTSSPQPVTQSSQRVVKKQIHLAALGDSLTEGVGDQAKQGGYVGIIKQTLAKQYHNQVVTNNFGKSGDRSDQILKRLNTQPQIKTGLKQADVIVMTVGGNDLSQLLYAKAPGASAKQVDQAVAKGAHTYQQKLQRLYRAIREVNPHAPIFVISVYNPYYVYFPNITTMNDAVTQWNRVTKQTLTKHPQTYFVNIQQTMSYGQYQTAAQRSSLVARTESANRGKTQQQEVVKVMKTKRNLNQYISTGDNYHPNHRGYEKMAAALLKNMQQHDQFEYETKAGH